MPASAPSSAGGSPSPDHRLLAPASGSAADSGPLVICFHGSGEACAPSWTALAGLLVQRRRRVLLFERGPDNPAPAPATAALRRYLAARRLAAPYVLVAHSYGGAFARAFLQAAPGDVAGLVLAETGQEGGLDPRVVAAQLDGRVMGAKPVAVVRGNSFIGKAERLDAMAQAAAAATPAEKAALATQRDMLRLADREDERMKKAQLRLSSTSKYVHLPDCGHHVVRDRPDVIADEVDWVFATLRQSGGLDVVEAEPRFWLSIRMALARASRRLKNMPPGH